MQVLLDSKELTEIKNLQEEILQKLSMQVNSDKLVTLEQAEILTEMEKQTLRKMFLDGKIEGKRFGRAIRLSKTHLLKCQKKA